VTVCHHILTGLYIRFWLYIDGVCWVTKRRFLVTAPWSAADLEILRIAPRSATDLEILRIAPRSAADLEILRIARWSAADLEILCTRDFLSVQTLK
jgi:hypothetical protein